MCKQLRHYICMAVLYCGVATPWMGVLAIESSKSPLATYESDFDRLTKYLQRAGEYEQREFAYLAITEMLSEHEQAMEALSGRRASSEKARQKIYRWTAATQRFVDDLARTLERVDTAYEVRVIHGLGGTSQILVDRRPVLISSLDIRTPRTLERAIISAYCTYNDCRFLNTVALQDGPTSPSNGLSGWSFADGSLVTYVSGDGLNFMFANLNHRQLKEQVCLSVIDELRTLVQWLRHTKNDGHRIEWNALEARADRVIVNSAGGFIRLPLPSLGRSQTLLSMALPWIRARVAGKPYDKFFPGSELMFSGLLSRNG